MDRAGNQIGLDLAVDDVSIGVRFVPQLILPCFPPAVSCQRHVIAVVVVVVVAVAVVAVAAPVVGVVVSGGAGAAA